MDKKYLTYMFFLAMLVVVLGGVYFIINSYKDNLTCPDVPTQNEIDTYCKVNFVAKSDVNGLINLTNKLVNLTNNCYASYNVTPLSYISYYNED